MGEVSKEKTASAANRAALSPRDFLMLVLGFGCLIGYARVASLGFDGYAVRVMAQSVDAWYGLRTVASLVTLALLALNGLCKRVRIGKALVAAATVCAMAAPFLEQASGMGAVGSVLGGVFVSVLMYVWMLLLSTRQPDDIVAVTAVGLVVAGAIIMGAPRLGAPWTFVLVVVSAAVTGAAALLQGPAMEACQPDGVPDKSELSRVPWVTVVMLAACGFLATVLYGIAQHLTGLYDWAPNYIALGVAAVAVVVATLALIVMNPGWMHLVWIPYFALLVLALAFSCVSVRYSIQTAVGFLLASVFCAHFIHWVAYPAMLARLRIPRAFLAAVMLIVTNASLATLTGDMLGSVLPHSMQSLGGVAGITVIVLGLFYIATYFIYRRAFGTVGFFGGLLSDGSAAAPSASWRAESADSSSDDGGNADLEGEAALEVQDVAAEADPVDALRERVGRYTDQYGLTPREAEVALLTMQGFSCSYIAEKLVVSNSTVRFHQQNLYRKFDVHSRNELIELASMPE